MCGGELLPKLANYIRKRAQDAKGPQPANLNGLAVKVLEWKIERKDLWDALFFVPVWLVKQKKGPATLSVYVAEELGYAVPRIAAHGPDGKLVFSVDAVDFRQAGRGIWFPHETTVVYNSGGSTTTHEYLVKTIEINEPIPKDAFKILLPAGTRVRDSRPGVSQIIFKLRSDAVLVDPIMLREAIRAQGRAIAP